MVNTDRSEVNIHTQFLLTEYIAGTWLVDEMETCLTPGHIIIIICIHFRRVYSVQSNDNCRSVEIDVVVLYVREHHGQIKNMT